MPRGVKTQGSRHRFQRPSLPNTGELFQKTPLKGNFENLLGFLAECRRLGCLCSKSRMAESSQLLADRHSELHCQAMQFIEMTGKVLLRILTEDDPTPQALARIGLTEDSIVRINRQGDIELRRRDRWDVIGGLLGDFEQRVRHETGLDWA